MIPVIRADWKLTGGAWLFFRRRARRILPPYYFAMAASLLLIFTVLGSGTGTPWESSLPVLTRDFLTHLFLVQDVFSDTAYKINRVFWSISVEWRIYFLFPLLVIAFRKIGITLPVILLAIASLLIWLGLGFLSHFVPDLNLGPPGICPHYLLLFGLGMAAAVISFASGRFADLRRRVPWGVALVFTTALCVVTLFSYHFSFECSWQMQDVCVGLWALCLLVYVADAASRKGASALIHSTVGSAPLAFIGTFAYSIYLMHAPILELIWKFVLAPLQLAPEVAVWALVLGGVPVIWLLSYVFFLFCEKPFTSAARSR
jgi:peptidoglycan/LPS O-acetylase OafA/YrhL